MEKVELHLKQQFIRRSSVKLETKIRKAIQACKVANLESNAFGYLPSIINSLEFMFNVLRSGGETIEKRCRRTAGLFRIVSDDEEFLNSPLGKRLVRLMNEYRK